VAADAARKRSGTVTPTAFLDLLQENRDPIAYRAIDDAQATF
jgi:hypothetical protein